jgi:hypothetical protein
MTGICHYTYSSIPLLQGGISLSVKLQLENKKKKKKLYFRDTKITPIHNAVKLGYDTK